jgi:hypothetical protein
MDSSSSNNMADLRQPLLLGDDIEVGVPVTAAKKVTTPTTHELDVGRHERIGLPGDDEPEDDDDDEENSFFCCCNEDMIMWIVLPALLLSQFGMAFWMHDERTGHLSWTIVNLSIGLFGVTAWLYRHACADARVETILILLLPEILMDVVLGLVRFNQVALGYMVLLGSMLTLSTFVVGSTTMVLYKRRCREQRAELATKVLPL